MFEIERRSSQICSVMSTGYVRSEKRLEQTATNLVESRAGWVVCQVIVVVGMEASVVRMRVDTAATAEVSMVTVEDMEVIQVAFRTPAAQSEIALRNTMSTTMRGQILPPREKRLRLPRR